MNMFAHNLTMQLSMVSTVVAYYMSDASLMFQRSSEYAEGQTGVQLTKLCPINIS